MSKVNLMTQTEYAKHRGCSAVAVHRAIKEKRISLIDGKIDPAVADIQWAANTRARAGARASQPAQPVPAVQARTPAPDRPASPPEETEGYWNSRSRREAAEAKIAEMKEAEMRGELVRISAMRVAWGNKLTATRNALLQLTPRLSPMLAAETDIEKIAELLDHEFRTLLGNLAEPAGAIGGE